VEIRQGDIFWVDANQPIGSAPGFTRPFVVVQNNLFNRGKINTVLVCALTTNLSRAEAPGNVRLYKTEANLPKSSVVVVSQMLTIDKSELREKIGTLSKRRVDEIIEGIKLLTEPRDVDEEIE
jgi:mRNA interferase MazF